MNDQSIEKSKLLPFYTQVLWESGFPVNPDLIPIDTRQGEYWPLSEIILTASKLREQRGEWPGAFVRNYGELYILVRQAKLLLWGAPVTFDELEQPYQSILGDALFTKTSAGTLRVFVIRDDKDMRRFIERCTQTGYRQL